MTTKNILTFLASIIAFTLLSCDKVDNSSKEITETETNQVDKTSQKSNSSSISIGGTYSFGEDIEKGHIGTIFIYPLTKDKALFYLDVNRGAPSYNMGLLFGELTIKENIGFYDSNNDEDLDCAFKFEFTSDQVKVTTKEGHDNCGFGGNVYADFTYKRIDKTLPKYFIEMEGDTVYFKGLTVAKYNHRFD